MNSKTEAKLTGLFDQAVQTFGDAMKAGVKFQEEMSKLFTEMLDQAGPMQEWQRQSRALMGDAVPAAQKSVEQWMKLAQQNYLRSLDLFKRAFETEQPSTGQAATEAMQNRTQDLWEASMEMVRGNAQAVAQANAKMMETWVELLRKNNGAQMAVAS
jgi:BMFP domain-containing protein YqiC